MRRLFTLLAALLTLSLLASAALGQEGAPVLPESFELAPGVTANNVVFVAGQDNPSLYHLQFAPGVSYLVQPSTNLELVLMESGSLTVRFDATVTVPQLNGADGSGEVVAAHTEVILSAGQYFVLPPGVSGEVRNDGDETAIVSVAGMVPGGAASPAAAIPSGNFITPEPSSCRIEPRSLDSVVMLLGTPVVDSPATPASDGAVPADAAVVAAVTALAEESVACLNAGNFLAQFAFYTDEALLALIPPGLAVDDLTAFLGAPPEPLPVEARESVMVRDVMVLPNGQITADVVLRNVEGTFTTFVTLELQGDKLVIVSDINVDAELATPAA